MIRRLEAAPYDETTAKSFARAARSWGDVDVDGLLRDIYSA